MNRKQETRASMILATIDFCEENTGLISPLPNFSTNLSLLKTTSGQIHQVAQEQSVDGTGTTVAKTDSRLLLVSLAADTSRKLTAFARLTNDKKLLKEVDYSETSLMRQADTVLADTCQLVYERAQSNMGSLTDYLVTENSQAALLQAIDKYRAILASPRLTQVTKTQATKRLAGLFMTADKTLGQMDAVVEIIRMTEPDFYRGYKLARKLVESGNRKLILKGLVTDLVNGEPLKGVTVSFWMNGDNSKVPTANTPAILTKKTAGKGGFYVKKLESGSYHVVVKKAGYSEQNLTVYINEGEMTLIDIKMEQV